METFFPPIDSVSKVSLLVTPSPALNTTQNPNTSLKMKPAPAPTPSPTTDPMIIIDSPVERIELKSPKKEKDDADPLTIKKKPTRFSDVWEHFTKIKGGNKDEPRCKCNYCRTDYACHTTRVGTSSLWGHLKKCKKYPNNVADRKQKVLSFKRGLEGEGNLLIAKFNKVRCRSALARFLVKDEQAFNVVEGEGFKNFINELQPRFVVPGRMTVTRNIYTLFCTERSKLKQELTIPGQKISLTTGILAIPVSSVASESAFSTSGRILDPFPSSLSPKMVEALICTQSWLKGSHGGIKSNNYFDEIFSYDFIEVEDNLGKNKDNVASNEKTKASTINVVDD